MSWRTVVVSGVALGVATAAIVAVAKQAPMRTSADVHPERRTVTETSLSCPESPARGGLATSVFAVGPKTSTRGPATSSLTVTGSGPGSGAPVAQTTTGGVPLRASVDARIGQPSALVSATGSLAPGATAAQLSTYTGKGTNGIAASWCQSPRGQWWFAGVDTSVGTTTRLVLSNPSPANVVVDLDILGPQGLVDAAGSHGIAVAPASRLVLDLARYAPGRAALTLHVTATRGAVAAAVSTTRLDGITPDSSEWVPASAAPATSVVVNACLAGPGTRTLVVANPTDREQLVGVSILDQDGAFTSTVLPTIELPPGAVVTSDITSIVHKNATAIELSAPGPVTGTVISEQPSTPADFSVSAATDPLGSPAVVPIMSGTSLSLSFATSSPAPQIVLVRGVDRRGVTAGSAQVAIKGSATTVWAVPAGWAASYVVITVPPGSALHAVANYVGTAGKTGASGVTQLPVLSGRWTVLRPTVLP